MYLGGGVNLGFVYFSGDKEWQGWHAVLYSRDARKTQLLVDSLPVYVNCIPGQKMIKFLLMVNRQGQTRLSRYYHPVELGRRAQLEADVVRCCLGRTKDQVTA